MFRKAVGFVAVITLSGLLLPAIVAAKGPAGIVLPQGTLPGQEIINLVSGKTVIVGESRKKESQLFFFANGDLRKVTRKGDYLKGKWKVANDRLCTTLKGGKDCRAVVRQNDSYRTYIIKKDNRHKLDETFASIVPGNLIFASLDEKLSARIPLPAGALNAEEVLQLFYKRTVESVTAVKKRKSRSYYAPDGEVRQYRNKEKRTGKWRIREDGRICLKMEDFPEKCRIIVKEDGQYKKYIVKKNGQHVHSVSYPEFRKGNPYHL